VFARSQIDSAIDLHSEGHGAPSKSDLRMRSEYTSEPLLPCLDGSAGMLPLHRASLLGFSCSDIVFELLLPSL